MLQSAFCLTSGYISWRVYFYLLICSVLYCIVLLIAHQLCCKSMYCFIGVCLSLCLSVQNLRPERCSLTWICHMPSVRSWQTLETFDLDIWPWELLSDSNSELPLFVMLLKLAAAHAVYAACRVCGVILCSLCQMPLASCSFEDQHRNI